LLKISIIGQTFCPKIRQIFKPSKMILRRLTRTKRDGIEEAVEAFQRAAGAFNYIRLNFSNAPTADMSPTFLNTIVNLMIAQG